MSHLLYESLLYKTYITALDDGDIEVSIGVDDSIVCFKVKDLDALAKVIEKLDWAERFLPEMKLIHEENPS